MPQRPRARISRVHGGSDSRSERLTGSGLALRTSLAAALLLAVLLAGASTAGAVLVRLKSGASISYQPASLPRAGHGPGARAKGRFDEFFTNLDYNGGRVMTSNTNYAVYWDPKGAPAYPPDYKPGVNLFFEDLAHDSGGHENVDSVSTQYNDTTGEFAAYNAHFGGALIDETPYPGNGCTRAPICLTDEQLRTELANFVIGHKLPTDLAHEYFLLTPEGVEDCFEAPGEECSANVTEAKFRFYCAYHGNIPLVGGGELVYSDDPFVTGKNCDAANHPNGKTSDGALIGGLSHEHVESVTDPEPNNAWTDFGHKVGGEIGDKCRTLEEGSEFGAPLGKAGNGAKYNQVINGHFYWYQQEWSNKGHQCLQRLTFNAAEAPVAMFASEATPGDEIRFNAAGSTAGAGVRYNWQFNDRSFSENLPFETELLTTAHTFSEAGRFTVALTVFKPDGTSYGTAQAVTAMARVSQAIQFTSSSPGGASVGGTPYVVAATASSGLAVAFSSETPSVCTVSGSTVSFIGAGTCTIAANQAGNASYSAAPQVQQSFGVGAKAASMKGLTLPRGPVSPVSPVAPNSSFSSVGATVNQKTGGITFTEFVENAGTLNWLLTFPNGKFGVFAAKARKCKAGLIRLNGRCQPAKIVFARGRGTVSAPGTLSFTIKPSASALKALKNALQRKRGLPVKVTLTFQSSLGGSPAAHTWTLTVKLKK